MIHARRRGESFGLSIAEFSITPFPDPKPPLSDKWEKTTLDFSKYQNSILIELKYSSGKYVDHMYVFDGATSFNQPLHAPWYRE